VWNITQSTLRAHTESRTGPGWCGCGGRGSRAGPCVRQSIPQ
jgi:hypothetical protein